MTSAAACGPGMTVASNSPTASVVMGVSRDAAGNVVQAAVAQGGQVPASISGFSTDGVSMANPRGAGRRHAVGGCVQERARRPEQDPPDRGRRGGRGGPGRARRAAEAGTARPRPAVRARIGDGGIGWGDGDADGCPDRALGGHGRPGRWAPRRGHRRGPHLQRRQRPHLRTSSKRERRSPEPAPRWADRVDCSSPLPPNIATLIAGQGSGRSTAPPATAR